jgi:hypothetical protein
MRNSELIADILGNFERIEAGKNETVKPALNAITRLISLLKARDREDNLHLLKISSDLKSAEESESQFFTLNNPRTKDTEYSDSFYQSIHILKEELFQILDQLKEN